jgi:hypothetical protein
MSILKLRLGVGIVELHGGAFHPLLYALRLQATKMISVAGECKRDFRGAASIVVWTRPSRHGISEAIVRWNLGARSPCFEAV